MAKEREKYRRIRITVIDVAALLIFAWIPSCVNGTDQNDTLALNVLYTTLNSPTQLTGWTANGGDPCGQSWLGVICSGSSVTSIKLSGLGLSGNLGYNLNIMTSLALLDLSNNAIGNGGPISFNLPPNLQTLILSGNQFNGVLPYSISLMVTLTTLELSHNQLQGNLTDIFGSLSNLATMDLSFNMLTGDLPQSFGSLTSLTTLYLENNQFTGHIDILAGLPLQNLNVANNHFTGWIPYSLTKINNLQTGGNLWSSGPAPPPPPYTPPPPSGKSSPDQNNNSSSGGGNSGISAGAIAGIIVAVLVIGGISAIFLIRRKSQKISKAINLEQDQPFAPLAINEYKEMKMMQPSSTFNTTISPRPPSLSLKPPPVDRHSKSYTEGDFFNNRIVKKANMTPNKATAYSVADLQIATDSFNINNLIGEGSFARVYRALFSDGKVLAVKKLYSSSLPSRLPEDFIELVSNISCLHHPNLSELVGYCCEYGQHLLVYEFHKNGSLHDFLHIPGEHNKPLSWSVRVKIALGTARALEYLHEVCSPSLVHKNFKSSNILLDMELTPHLSDCGFENLVPNAEFQASEINMGLGYNAPEVAMSGQYTLKSDVYSFGVVMLELMTGRKPFDSSRPRSEQSLVRWASPQLHDIDALERMVDPALKGLYPAKSVSRFADVIALCVQPEPEFRPPMSEVVQALVRLVQRVNMNNIMVGGDGQESRAADEADDYVY